MANVFYTDSNGLGIGEESLQRQNSESEENFYPVSKFIQIADAGSQASVSIMTERAHGGTSPEEGVIEIAYHRTSLGMDSHLECLRY